MKKTRLVIIGSAVLLLTFSSVYAQAPGADRPARGRMEENIYKELNLTTEQQGKLEENRNAQRQVSQQLRKATKEKEMQLQEALKGPAVTRGEVEPLVKEIKSLQEQLIDQRISGIFAVKEILTPEQNAKFNELMEKRKEERKGHFQKWRAGQSGFAQP